VLVYIGRWLHFVDICVAKQQNWRELTSWFANNSLQSVKMAGLPQTLGFEGLQVQKGAHAGKSIAVFTSGGDSQGKVILMKIIITHNLHKPDCLIWGCNLCDTGVKYWLSYYGYHAGHRVACTAYFVTLSWSWEEVLLTSLMRLRLHLRVVAVVTFDAGMNAAVRAVVRMGLFVGCKVYLIKEVGIFSRPRLLLGGITRSISKLAWSVLPSVRLSRSCTVV